MNLKIIHDLLNEKGYAMILDGNCLKEDTGPWNDYRKLRLNNGKWELINVKWERANGEEEILSTFENEKTACKFWYLRKIRSYYIRKYPLSFKYENKEFDYDQRDHFTLEILKEMLHRVGIPEQYYSLDGKLKEHSVVLERINEKKSKMLHIGRNLQKVSETLVLDNWEIYDEIFTDAYMIYLLDQECDELIKKGVIEERFTDEDYRFFLSPDF